MFINSIAHYLPSLVITNEHFLDKNGLTDEWIYTRTGIKERRRATPGENTSTMALEAVKKLMEVNKYPINEVDLIVGASYSPYDTVATMAHYVQANCNIPKARCIYLSTACSSFINALEVVEGYFASGKSNKALIALGEHNTLYSDDFDKMAGHLWGDGGAALCVSKERLYDDDIEIIEIVTEGLSTVGKGPNGVWLHLRDEGLKMPYGKDVFIYACTYMAQVTKDILANNGYTINDLDYYIPHQANIRIINNVAHELGISSEKTIVNIERLGNTGCASTAIGLSENYKKMGKGKLICLSVFGGGYSGGAALLKT